MANMDQHSPPIAVGFPLEQPTPMLERYTDSHVSVDVHVSADGHPRVTITRTPVSYDVAAVFSDDDLVTEIDFDVALRPTADGRGLVFDGDHDAARRLCEIAGWPPPDDLRWQPL